MSAHDDAINLPLTQERKQLVGCQAWPDHDLTLNTSVANALRQGLQMLNFGTGGCGIVVVADT
jgi:hypothetical protein